MRVPHSLIGISAATGPAGPKARMKATGSWACSVLTFPCHGGMSTPVPSMMPIGSRKISQLVCRGESPGRLADPHRASDPA
jgi:hypothetical protein